MELFRDTQDQVYHALKKEFHQWCGPKNQWGAWSEFVDTQELGIRTISQTSDVCEHYEITDPRQWCITRLRYGIV